jgi:hypothetical protein
MSERIICTHVWFPATFQNHSFPECGIDGQAVFISNNSQKTGSDSVFRQNFCPNISHKFTFLYYMRLIQYCKSSVSVVNSCDDAATLVNGSTTNTIKIKE